MFNSEIVNALQNKPFEIPKASEFTEADEMRTIDLGDGRSIDFYLDENKEVTLEVTGFIMKPPEVDFKETFLAAFNQLSTASRTDLLNCLMDAATEPAKQFHSK